MSMIQSYNKLSIGKWQQIYQLNNNNLDYLDKSIELLKILSGHDEPTLLALDIIVFKKMVRDSAFLESKFEGKLIEKFTIKDTEYIVNWRVEEKKAGAFIDLSKFTQKIDATNDNLHLILAVLCVPEGEEYYKNILQRAEIFKEHLTMDLVFPICSFFLKVWKGSQPYILDYLQMNLKAKAKAVIEKQHITNTGGGL